MSDYRKSKKKSVHIRRQWAGVSSTTGHIYELAECGKNDPYATEYIRGDIHARALIDTTAERDALRERVAKLEAALRPFANYAAHGKGSDLVPDNHALTQGSRFAARQITMGDMRNARTALQEDTPND